MKGDLTQLDAEQSRLLDAMLQAQASVFLKIQRHSSHGTIKDLRELRLCFIDLVKFFDSWLAASEEVKDE